MEIRDFRKTALVYRDSFVDYGAFIKAVERHAALLKIRPGDRVLLFAENRPQWLYALFAVWRMGGTAVPVDFLSSAKELAFIIEDARPQAVFTSQARGEVLSEALSLSGSRPDVLVFEDFSPEGGLASAHPPAPNGGAGVMLLLYTSGTTGNPKGVMLTRSNLESNIHGIVKAGIASRNDRILAMLPFHHSYPLMVTVLLPIALGATVVIAEKISGEEILRLLRKHRITIIAGVPRVFQLLHRDIVGRVKAAAPARFLFRLSKRAGSLRFGRTVFRGVHLALGGSIAYFVSGGAKLDEQVALDLRALGLAVVEGYGLTETSPIVSFNPPDRIRIGSAGRPIEGVKVRIEDGEILVQGPNVMRGYLNQDGKTAEVIREGWFHTGDRGRIDEDGYLFITGRNKDMIVLSSGKNINPEEVEAGLQCGSEFVKEAAVVEKGGRLLALIYPDFDALRRAKVTNIEEKFKWDVVDRYNMTVPAFKRISGFRIVHSEFPKTRLGKIKRFLLDGFLEDAGAGVEGGPEPGGEVYAMLKEYLMRVTGRPVAADAHIEVDLGLDSLDKVEFLSFVEQSFGVRISEEDLSGLLLLRSLHEYVNRERSGIQAADTGWDRVLRERVQVDVSSSLFLVYFLKLAARPFLKPFFRLEVQGLDHTPDGPLIIAPNHQSYLDGFLILASLPNSLLRNTYFFATEHYFRSRFRRAVARQAHVLPLDVNRNLKEALKKGAALLRDGKTVVIFPEGARTRDGRLLPFKKAFAILSRELDVPVVPVGIRGAYEAYPIGAFFPKPGKISISFLPPIHPGGRDPAEIAEEVRRAVGRCLEAR